LKLAQATRATIERMLRDGLLESWEEAIDPAEDQFDAGYAPPAHELNAEQESALKAVRARFALGEFGVQLLHGVTGSARPKCICARCKRRWRAGKRRSSWCRDCVDLCGSDGSAARGLARSSKAWRCAFGAERRRASARMVARAKRRSARRRRTRSAVLRRWTLSA